MNVPDDVKKNQFVLYITGRFVNELLPKLLKDWSNNRRGR